MKLLFLHLPKAGGSTLHSIIDRTYNRNEILTLKPLEIPKNGNSPSRYLTGVEKRIATIDFNQQNNIKIIKGHFYFGLHEFLNEPCTYFTLFRNPVERVISQYYFTRNRPNDVYGEIVGKIDLKEYVERDYEVNNLQTKILYGKGYEKVENQHELLDKALQNLENHFSFVGLTEEFNKTLIMLNSILNLRITSYISQNVSKRPKENMVDDNTIKLIKERNSLDIALYNKVKDDFHRKWKMSKLSTKVNLLNLKIGNLKAKFFNTIEYKDGF